MLNDRMITRFEECAPVGWKSFDYTKSLSASRRLCKVRMPTADADGGRRMADGGRRTDKKKKKITEKKNDMKNNKLIIEIVGQL